ncbi:hypothetical protein RE628_06280 [Paenibacillus sp. D2_2]|uniref:hypothetical protein n=1 Tax=Paenibacillus sp. D2_2 TaxID=3073092 RepID=UPI002815DBDB|nr:hypothetical protein [Paenibacillus sp. D2_2]WMT42040.1 hypothetical protein RE628_06280 [Paenibacillus sp. D2_2]
MGILLIILLSIILEPMREMLNLTVEKIKLGTAITNAARSAKDRSLEYDSQKNLDAQVDQEKFAGYFADAFEDALNLTCTNKKESYGYLKFKSNDGKYNDFIVTLEYKEKEDLYTEQVVTKVEMKAESEYKFKTKYLKMAEDASEDVATQLISERTLILSIKN